jgi:hypothetical protein
LTNACPNLYYFDDRPVTEIDRAAAKAWETGGLEAERAVRQEKMANKTAEFNKSCLRNAKNTEEKRAARKEAMAKMYEEIKNDKSELISKKMALEREIEVTDEMDAMKNVLRNKVRIIEEKLTIDYY